MNEERNDSTNDADDLRKDVDWADKLRTYDVTRDDKTLHVVGC